MQGLAGILREESKDADKEDILDVSFLTEDQDQARNEATRPIRSPTLEWGRPSLTHIRL